MVAQHMISGSRCRQVEGQLPSARDDDLVVRRLQHQLQLQPVVVGIVTGDHLIPLVGLHQPRQAEVEGANKQGFHRKGHVASLPVEPELKSLCRRRATEQVLQPGGHPGPLPHGAGRRVHWESAAATVAAYRDRHGVTDPDGPSANPAVATSGPAARIDDELKQRPTKLAASLRAHNLCRPLTCGFTSLTALILRTSLFF